MSNNTGSDPQSEQQKLEEAAVDAVQPEEMPKLTNLRELFELAFSNRSSDIHLTEHSPPMLRIDGHLTPTRLAPLSRGESKKLVYSVLTDRQRAEFERELELDLSVDIHQLGRFRVNVHMQRGSVEAAFRLVPKDIPCMADLGLPPVVADLTRKPNGLVLVTGPTGVGKSTTMASMVNLINTERSQHIITIEDPIEYVHSNKKCIIKQREVYADTKSFSNALIKALRQDPDIIIVGEMTNLRDDSDYDYGCRDGTFSFCDPAYHRCQPDD